jgi:PAS domain S-box-containing protein
MVRKLVFLSFLFWMLLSHFASSYSAETGSVISGSVLMPDNSTPHVALVVQLVFPPPSPGEVTTICATTVTDEFGEFQFSDVPPESYLVRCYTLEGYVYYDNGKTIQIAPNSHWKIGDFRVSAFKKGRWSHLTYLDGLIANKILRIVQDSGGGFWFSSQSGLSRYDGMNIVNYEMKEILSSTKPIKLPHRLEKPLCTGTDKELVIAFEDEIRVFTTDDGIPTPVVNNTYEDHDGSIWLATPEGACHYDGIRFTTMKQPDGMKNNFIHAISRGPDGDMWFGTLNGLYRYDGQTIRSYFADISIACLSWDSKGMLWVGTWFGLSRFDGEKFKNFTTEEGLISNRINDIYQDLDGVMWFSSRAGVIRYDGKGFVNYTQADGLIDSDISEIYRDPSGIMWFVTSKGVSRYDMESFRTYTIQDGLLDNYIHFIVEDHDGLIWLGSRGGVSKWDGNTFVNYTTEDGLGSNDVLSAHISDSGNLWVGTWGGGIARFDGDTFTRIEIPENIIPEALLSSAKHVNAISSDSQGRLWIGTEGGLYSYDGSDFSMLLEQTGIQCITRAMDGSMWFGAGWYHTSRSLYQFDGKNFHQYTTEDGLPHSVIFSIKNTRDNKLWITTADGIAHFDKKVWTTITKDDGLVDNAVRSVYMDTDGVMWFGTSNGGMSGFDGHAWTSFDTRHGLPANKVKAIHEDTNGNLWFGTSGGLVRYKKSQVKPEVRISSVQTAASEFRLDQAILPINSGERITISYDSIDFKTHPKDRLFRYRINEISEDWSKPSREKSTDVRFDEPGSYTFTIQSIDRDLQYSPIQSVALEIVLPWYKNSLVTTPISLLFFLLSILTMFFGTRYLAHKRKVQVLRKQAWSLLESAPDGMVVVNREGKIVMVNDQVEVLFGYTKHEIMDQPVDMLFPVRFHDRHDKHIKHLFQEPSLRKNGTDWELFAKMKNGNEFPVDITLSTVKSEDELLVTAAIRDITERKIVEDELKHSKVRAEDATKAKSEFLANMSHELRTPMTAILGFTEMLGRDREATGDQREKLGIINRSGVHLLEMINDVLDLSKIEAGRTELEQEVVDLPLMLEDVGRMFELRAENAGLRFDLEFDSELAQYIKSDIGKLRQILINLLGNAVKFTDEGGVSLRARTLPIADDPSAVILQLEVKDTGYGISPEMQAGIFDPFVQAGHSPAAAKGTGLGLAISKSFVEMMDGEISIDSTPDKGSLFRVKLPVALSEAAEVADVRLAGPAVLGLEPGQTAWRILVVEDNLDNRLLLSSLLLQVGFEMQEAENGERAVVLFEQWQPHFIWMDMRMPVMDGYEATGKIRSLPGGDKVKIIAITASALKEQYKGILEAGCDEVVRKPFKDHEIFECMARHLGTRYLYEEKGEAAAHKPGVNLTAEMLAELPSALLQELRETTLALDSEAIYALIKRVESRAPDTARGLRVCMNNFQISRIRELLGAV